MGVTFPAWRTLEPNHVASGVENHENVPSWSSNTDTGEIFAAALRKTRDDGAAETSSGSMGTGFVESCCEGFDSGSISLESEMEELLWGFVGGGESVYVV